MADQMLLGDFINALRQRKQDERVRFDFCGQVPRGFASYRGYYDQLALEWGPPKYDEAVTVKDMLADAQRALTETFHGYKGGEYRMNLRTPLWVDNWGECYGTMIVGVDGDGETVIRTHYDRGY